MTKNQSNKPATIYDVADRAHVSHITVSRVVNGKTNVSDKTRQRVEEAMVELGYLPNPVAQALQTRRSRVVEFITTDLWGARPDALNMIMSRVQEHNYQLSVLPTTTVDLYGVLTAIPNRMVAGTLLYAQQTDIDYQKVNEITHKVPFVQMGGKLHNELPSVVYDQSHAAQIAIEHLIHLGHQHIAFIGGQQGLLDGQLRHEAYVRTLTVHGLEPIPVALGDFSIQSGANAMHAMLQSGVLFTALFTATDTMAMGALYVAREHGLRIPEDISIIGYDNDALDQFIHPRLTTVTNNFALLGQTAADYLLELIQSPDTVRRQRVLSSELIVRESTCPPKA